MTDRDCDAVIVGTGPAGATVADVLTAAGWSVIMLEKGRNHLLELEPPYGPLGHFSNDELKSPEPPLPRPRPAHRAAHLPPRARTTATTCCVGHVHALPSTVGGGGVHADGKLPRFRARTTSAAVDARSGRRRRRRRLARQLRRPRAVLRRGRVRRSAWPARRPTRSPRGGRRPFPMPPGADMYGAVLSIDGRRARAGSTPTVPRPASTRSPTTAGRPATTAGSAGTRAARSRPRATRSRCCGAPCAPAGARSGPSPTSCGVRPRRIGPPGDRRALPRRRPRRAPRCAPTTWSWPAGAFETPRLLLHRRPRQLVGPGRAQPHVPLPDADGRRVPLRRVGDAGPGASPHAHDDHIVGDAAVGRGGARRRAAVHPRRAGRARRRRPARSWRPSSTRPGPATTRVDARLVAARPDVGVHDAGRGPGPADEPHRPRPAVARRVGTSRPAG